MQNWGFLDRLMDAPLCVHFFYCIRMKLVTISYISIAQAAMTPGDVKKQATA